MVVFGRNKGDRGSYRQWVEGDIAPQVVFEILSPGNRMAEMSRKLHFYEQYGVEEYYIYDPDRIDFTGWIRHGDRLTAIEDADNWISPLLGIRFEMGENTLTIYDLNDRPFSSFVELDRLRQQAQQELQQSQQELQNSRQQSEKLAAKLRELGIDPSSL